MYIIKNVPINVVPFVSFICCKMKTKAVILTQLWYLDGRPYGLLPYKVLGNQVLVL